MLEPHRDVSGGGVSTSTNTQLTIDTVAYGSLCKLDRLLWRNKHKQARQALLVVPASGACVDSRLIVVVS